MEKRVSRKLVPGVIWGLVSGALLAPALLAMFLSTVLASPFVLLPTVAAAMLGAWAGWPALAASSVSCLAAGFSLGGGAAALVAAEIVLLPAWGIYMILARRPRFYEGVAQSAFLQLGALLVLLAGAWLVVRQDLALYFASQLRQLAQGMSWDYFQAMYAAVNQVTGGAAVDFAALGEAGREAFLDEWFALYTGQLQQSLPQILMCSGLLTGALAYWLSARILARRSDDPPVSYAHPRDWRLVGHLIVGPPVCALICYIAYQSGMEGADAAYLAIMGLNSLLFTVQGIGALDRMLFKAGASTGKRGVILVVMVLVAQLALPLIGVASALFGSKGLISQWLKKRGKDKGGDGR